MTMLMPKELTCKQVVEIVTDWLEGRMSIDDRTRFEQHLVYCIGCSGYVEQVRQTIALAGAAREPASAQAQEELVRLFRGWKEGK